MMGSFAVVVLVAAGLPMWAGVASSASVPSLLSVTASADPASGSEVHPGDSITYTLTAASPEPLSDGARIVDDLSGLVDHANLMSTADELAARGLTLDLQARTVTWDVPASTVPGAAGSEATTSFRVTVADTAPAGARLITAAAAEGDTCERGSTCATLLTVARPPDAALNPNPNQSEAAEASAVGSSTEQAPTGIQDLAQPPPTESAAEPPPESTMEGEPTGGEQPATSTTTTDAPTSATAPDTTQTVSAPESTAAPATSTAAATPTEPTGTDGTNGAAASDPIPQALAVDALAGPCTGAAPAAGSPVAGFEIDGNLCTDNAGNVDWDRASAAKPNQARAVPGCSGR